MTIQLDILHGCVAHDGCPYVCPKCGETWTITNLAPGSDVSVIGYCPHCAPEMISDIVFPENESEN